MSKLALHWWFVIALGLVGLGALDLGIWPWIAAGGGLVALGFGRRPYWSSAGALLLISLGSLDLALHWWVLVGAMIAVAGLMTRLALHWCILTAMGLGVLFGLYASEMNFTAEVSEYVAPIGTLFLNLLRMIAVPLVLFSLVAGVASLNDTAKLGRIGGKTILLYLCTTAVAITIGLITVNIVRPGSDLSPETRTALRDQMLGEYQQEVTEQVAQSKVNIIDQLVNIVPQNPFGALSDAEMLQVVFFALILGVALIRIGERASHVISVFQLLSDAVINMVHLIMKIAPFGVFALMAAVIASLGQDTARIGELLGALLQYMGTVVLGLLLHLLLVYTFLLKFVAKMPLLHFMRSIVPAQLLAFSSSSSGATLPVTMECVEKKVGVHEEVSSFVLPLGATINMDGTGLYQGVAAVFIATFYGMDLSLGQQLQIVLTASLASIGTAAVPGVGIVMLTIVLAQIDIPPEGIALILGVDRPLDMCRTVLNITGDATVATTVASTEGLLEIPVGKGGG